MVRRYEPGKALQTASGPPRAVRGRRSRTAVVVGLRGSLPSDSRGAVGEALRDALASGPKELIIDMSQVARLSHRCGAAFVSAAVRAQSAHVQLIIRDGGPQPWATLRTLGIAHLFRPAVYARPR